MSDSKGTRPPGRQPRHNPPRPPSTQPPSRGEGTQERSHEVFVQIASLQMAKARQKRIRSSLQDQVDTCTAEIERINDKIQALYGEAGLEAQDEEERSASRPTGEDGFEYEY